MSDVTPQAPPPPNASTTAPERRRAWPRILLSIASAAVLVLTLAGVGIQVMSTKLEGNITSVDISNVIGHPRPSTPVIDEQGNYAPMNILLMGSDTRSGQGSKYGDPKVYSGGRSDTTILLHLSADRTFATAVSIPRDTWVMLPKCPSGDGNSSVGEYESKFNAAYEIGGPGCTVKLVEQMTGLTIDHFAVIDFSGFKDMVDALGGVEVCLTEAVDDPKAKLTLPAGVSVVSGDQALGFVRARETIGDGSDLGRIKRQQAFLSSMVREASNTQLLLNPVKLYSVLEAATKSLTTDPGMANLDTIKQLALSVKDMSPSDITFLTMPWVPRGDGENVVVDSENATALWQAIAADQPWLKKKTTTTKDDTSTSPSPVATDNLTIQPANVSIRVLNGSGIPGRAAEVASALESEGFTIVDINDADRSDYTVTEIHHSAPLAEAARTVLAAMPGATTVADDQQDTITIIVGSNFSTVAPVDVPLNPTFTPSPAASAAPTPNASEYAQREKDEVTDPLTADKIKCG